VPRNGVKVSRRCQDFKAYYTLIAHSTTKKLIANIRTETG
jgi:hypothetical protein